MTDLPSVLKGLNLDLQGDLLPEVAIRTVTDHSGQCASDTLFVAVAGGHFDGHDFLVQAAQGGARVALVECTELPAPPGMTLLRVANTRRALALVAQRLAGDPSRRMRVVGVTGTNGKTTVVYLLEAIFRAAGLKPGVIGTIDYRWDDVVEKASQTTPSPTDLADRMARMAEGGVQAVAMEVSSHALDQHRVDGIAFAAAGLTNLTQDHLDYHRTMENYRRAKGRFFSEVLAETPGAMAVLNIDDPAGREYAGQVGEGRLLPISMHRSEAAIVVERIHFQPDGMTLDLNLRGRPLRIRTPMRGMFNAMNCLTAVSLAHAIDIPDEAIIEGCAKMAGAPGRFEFISAGQAYVVIVDYAHTPDALTQALLHARGIARGRLIALFGCGGDRDRGNRALMGRAAARLAHEIIITNDNPRGEVPDAIADAIAEGVKEGLRSTGGGGVQWRIELDRRQAIHTAIDMAGPGDVVLIAGKGHETYQITGPHRVHFDDRQEVRQAIESHL